MKRLLIVCAFSVPLAVFATDAPSLELLEFLGDWETSAGEWQDPLEFMQDMDALEADDQSTKVNTQKVNVEDEQDGQ